MASTLATTRRELPSSDDRVAVRHRYGLPKANPILAICLIGLGLRLNRIAEQSLWLDESAAYTFASLPVSELIAATFSREPNPPLYYLLLHFWVAFVGSSEFSLRLLSALAGVIAIPLVYRLGAQIASRSAGLGAAFLTSVSPYLIWYSQEARMYSLLATLSLATLLLLWQSARRSGRRNWLGFGILLLATYYTHFYGAFLGLVSAVFLLTYPRLWKPGLLTLGVTGLLYVPWLVSTLSARATRESWRADLSSGEIVQATVAAFAHGGFLPDPIDTWLILSLGAGACIGMIAIGRFGYGTWRSTLFLATALTLPILLVIVLSTYQAIFADRYVIALAPIFYLAVSAALTALVRRLAVAGAAVFLVLALVALVAIDTGWHDARFRKEDFRSAAAYLEKHATADDAIVLIADYTKMPFLYYYRGAAAIVPFWAHPEEPERVLQPLVEQHRIVWLLLSHAEQFDPQDISRRWLAERYPVVTEQYPQAIRLYGYRVQYRQVDLPEDVVTGLVRFGDHAELIGYRSESNIPPTDEHLHPPSNWLHVTLFWRTTASLGGGYHSSVRLIDGHGVWGEKLTRPAETLAFYPTHQWRVGEVVVEEVDVNLNPATPPGEYQLEVRLLREDGQPLPVTEGSAIVGTVRITATSPQDGRALWRPDTTCTALRRAHASIGEHCARVLQGLRHAPAASQ